MSGLGGCVRLLRRSSVQFVLYISEVFNPTNYNSVPGYALCAAPCHTERHGPYIAVWAWVEQVVGIFLAFRSDHLARGRLRSLQLRVPPLPP